MEFDGPRILKLEPGLIRIQQMMGAERAPAYIGAGCGALMIYIALCGSWWALKGIWLWPLWHGIAVLMFRRDPQYWSIMWRREWSFPWPSKLYAAPGICAPAVPFEASVPVRGEVGVYGE